ncbi:hypothetical protein D3C86_2166990 [compost metagenome]
MILGLLRTQFGAQLFADPGLGLKLKQCLGQLLVRKVAIVLSLMALQALFTLLQ